LLLDPFFRETLEACEGAWRNVAATAVRCGIPVPAMSAALSYFDGYTSDFLPRTFCRPSAIFRRAYL
jgi:6-phosphogluconate dehydrogenase